MINSDAPEKVVGIIKYYSEIDGIKGRFTYSKIR